MTYVRATFCNLLKVTFSKWYPDHLLKVAAKKRPPMGQIGGLERGSKAALLESAICHPPPALPEEG